MVSVRRFVVLTVFGLFALTLGLRPLSRFVGAGFTEDGFDASILYLAIPTAIVILVMMAVGFQLLFRTGSGPNSEGRRKQSTGTTDSESETETRNETGFGNEREDESGERENTPQQPPSILTGQGGTRNRGFEIEELPPETTVDEHLDYLDDVLGDDDIREDTETAAEDAMSEGERTHHLESGDPEKVDTDDRTQTDISTGANRDTVEIPAACPQPYCDANWSRTGLFTRGGKNYERLDNGTQIRCETCGGITTVE